MWGRTLCSLILVLFSTPQADADEIQNYSNNKLLGQFFKSCLSVGFEDFEMDLSNGEWSAHLTERTKSNKPNYKYSGEYHHRKLPWVQASMSAAKVSQGKPPKISVNCQLVYLRWQHKMNKEFAGPESWVAMEENAILEFLSTNSVVLLQNLKNVGFVQNPSKRISSIEMREFYHCENQLETKVFVPEVILEPNRTALFRIEWSQLIIPCIWHQKW